MRIWRRSAVGSHRQRIMCSLQDRLSFHRYPQTEERELSNETTLTFGRMAPTIPVTDLPKALAFFCDVLGFVILERDAAELHLTLNSGHKATTENVAHLMVSNATALYDHCIANHVRIVKGIRDADYGLRSFVFADPDGNRFDVGEPI